MHQDRNSLISQRAWSYFSLRIKLFAIWAIIAVLISNFFPWVPFTLFRNVIPVVTILLIIEIFIAYFKKRKLERAFRRNAQIRRLKVVRGPHNLRYEFQFIYSKIVYARSYNLLIISWDNRFFYI